MAKAITPGGLWIVAWGGAGRGVRVRRRRERVAQGITHHEGLNQKSLREFPQKISFKINSLINSKLKLIAPTRIQCRAPQVLVLKTF